MSQFIPKFVDKDSWVQLLPNNVYAVRLETQEPVRFRFGVGIGVYVEISRASNGHVINFLDFETGDPTLGGKLNDDSLVVIGRTSECNIKIAQPIMSRQHLELKVWEKKILLAKDLGSTNGTFVWTNSPIDNLTGLSTDIESSEELEKKFGIDITPLLNEHSQSKGS